MLLGNKIKYLNFLYFYILNSILSLKLLVERVKNGLIITIATDNAIILTLLFDTLLITSLILEIVIPYRDIFLVQSFRKSKKDYIHGLLLSKITVFTFSM